MSKRSGSFQVSELLEFSQIEIIPQIMASNSDFSILWYVAPIPGFE